MTEHSPKTATALFGHDEAESVLLRGLAEGKLAHGWIISGPPGIGKATLAYRFARTLLAGEEGISENHPVFRRIVAGSHADMLVVEPLFDEKKEEYARDISVDQAREIAQFLSLTPGESQWRVVIVDAIDALNANAANAILKILEEPPAQAVLLLISHNPGRLLPTIRSRCRSLRLKPLSHVDFMKTLRHAAPQIEHEQMLALGQLSNQSPGIALALHEQEALEVYGEILSLMASLPELDVASLHSFAERMGTGTVHTNWQLLTRLMLCLIERASLQAAGAGVEPVSDTEADVLVQLAGLHNAAIWAVKWQQCAEQFSVAERLHLDYKQVIITFIHSILLKEGFQLGNAAA